MELLMWLILLTSDSIEAREEAAWRLREMGAAAWPVLERALESRDSELVNRAREILAAQSVPRELLQRHPAVARAARPPTTMESLRLYLRDPQVSREVSDEGDDEEPFHVPDPALRAIEIPMLRLQRLSTMRGRPVGDR